MVGGKDGLGAQQPLQNRVAPGFAFVGSQLQDLHILAAGLQRGVAGAQGVVGDAKPGGGKQVVAVSILGEGPRRCA